MLVTTYTKQSEHISYPIMVHTWISLTNDKMDRPFQNKRILRIFHNEDTRFYGDYNLDIYLSAKNDYTNIEAAVTRVIASRGGWIGATKMSDTTPCAMGRLDQYMLDCGNIPDREFKKMFPRREDGKVIKGLTVRKDGNFLIYGCETTRFYYVICFATS